MTNRIQKIMLSNCRGATRTTEIDIDANKPLVLIFGENGSGKSTIIDAIDMVCNRRCGTIDVRSSANISKHLPAIGSKASDVVVEITIKGNKWKATLVNGKILTDGPNPIPVAHILRRSQLLKLVEAQPAERYKELSKFVDVGAIAAAEVTLSEAKRNADTALSNKIEKKVEAENELKSLWEAEGSPGSPESSELTWAETKSNADTSDLSNTVSELTELLQYIDESIRARDDYSTNKTEKENKYAYLAEIENEIAQTEGITAQESLSIIDILEAVSNYTDPLSILQSCPVCEQPVVLNELRTNISSRLVALKDLARLNRLLKTAKSNASSAESLHEKSQSKFIQAVRSLATYALTPSITNQLPHDIDTRLLKQLLSNADIHAYQKIDQAETLTNKFEDSSAIIHTWKNDAQRDLNQFNAISQLYLRHSNGYKDITEAEETKQRLSRTYGIVHQKRIEYIQSILDTVGNECQRLYGLIHPGENLGLDKLRLDEKLRGSLIQDAHFEGIDKCPPQAYFSESHLDTLGFCFWLAIAKQSSGKDSIIVLDDVFTSVDSAHIRRIIDLLMDECANIQQLIITTHSRAWHDTHRYHQVAANKSHVIELSHWEKSRGILHHRSKLAIEHLNESISELPFDRQRVASEAGVLLEQVLDHLTLLYKCSLRRSILGDYNLSELIYGVKNLCGSLTVLRPTLSHNGDLPATGNEEPINLKALLDELADSTFIRNTVWYHYNKIGAEISEFAVEEFARKTSELASLLVCSDCGEVARKKKTTYYTCNCGALQMEPIAVI